MGTAVANTIAKTVKAEASTTAVVFAALFAAIAWNYVTWKFGMPSSSSHAIIGGLIVITALIGHSIEQLVKRH